jgi:hypothetical protein
MPGNPAVDLGAVVADGLAVLVGLSGDPSLAKGGTAIYGSLKDALSPEIRPGDHAQIALPCVRMADRYPALLVVLQERAILAWSAGRFRSTPRVETVPLIESWGATIAPGIGARQPVQVLTVLWAERPPWVVAVPSDATTTRFLRTCFIARP